MLFVGVSPTLHDKIFSSYLYSLKNASIRSGNMPKVSVIIPADKARAYLPESVESVLRQTFTDFEVLIINTKLL
jgi:cellulose synthase/poly-beta-1,6-N-acetylglucosamine synthase-like glycosyltransferase